MPLSGSLARCLLSALAGRHDNGNLICLRWCAVNNSNTIMQSERGIWEEQGTVSKNGGDTVGEPISTRQGCGCYFGFSMPLGLQCRHMRGTIFGTLGFANSIRRVFEPRN